MTYLIVGVDRDTHAPWHSHVLARSVAAATGIATARAAAQGIVLVIAAVIGPNSAVLAADETGPGSARLTRASRYQTSPSRQSHVSSPVMSRSTVTGST